MRLRAQIAAQVRLKAVEFCYFRVSLPAAISCRILVPRMVLLRF